MKQFPGNALQLLSALSKVELLQGLNCYKLESPSTVLREFFMSAANILKLQDMFLDTKIALL